LRLNRQQAVRAENPAPYALEVKMLGGVDK
jgi:hypothetical protein